MTSISRTSNYNCNSDQNPLIRTPFSKLNAKAPEFIPMNSNPPSPCSSPGPGDQPRLPPPSPPSVYVPIRGSGTYYPSPSPSPPHYAEQRYRKKQTGKDDQPPSGSLSRNNSAGYSGGSLSRSSSTGGGGGYNSDGDANYGLSDEATNKLINQVEYYFSDVNLATTDHLIKFIFKDPEGFVPISVVSSFKKIKALISSNSQLAAVLRNSTKLEVSEDGKKVKRVHRLASSDMEELQARIIVAENLPDDHCHQNLMKIFSVVGGVKSIRTCLPQPSSNATSPARSSKTDSYHNTKLHAFVEYESVELAEKAIVELNAEDSWRSGLRVRSLLKQAMKPVQGRAMKASNESEVNDEEVSVSTSESNRSEKLSDLFAAESGAQSPEHGDEQNLDKDGALKKSRNRTKGKGRGRGHSNNSNHHHQNNRGSQSPVHGEQPVVNKQPPGPRMPDGTRGFSMGRGKPLAVSTS